MMQAQSSWAMGVIVGDEPGVGLCCFGRAYLWTVFYGCERGGGAFLLQRCSPSRAFVGEEGVMPISAVGGLAVISGGQAYPCRVLQEGSGHSMQG